VLEAEESKVLVAEVGAAIAARRFMLFPHQSTSLMSCSNYAKQLLKQSDLISIDSSDRGPGRYPEIL
jgi:predicted metallo-beta-lactamase superfamily hydrolase